MTSESGTTIRPACLQQLNFDGIADSGRREAAAAEYRRLGIVQAVGELTAEEQRALDLALGHDDERADDDEHVHRDDVVDDRHVHHGEDEQRTAVASQADQLLAAIPAPDVVDDGQHRDLVHLIGTAAPFDCAIPLGRDGKGGLVAEVLDAQSFKFRPRAPLSVEHNRQRQVGHVLFARGLGGVEAACDVVLDSVEGRSAAALARHGSLTGLSVEFRPNPKADRVRNLPGGGVLIRRRNAVLTGLSMVVTPAYAPWSRVVSWINDDERYAAELARLADPAGARMRQSIAEQRQRQAPLMQPPPRSRAEQQLRASIAEQRQRIDRLPVLTATSDARTRLVAARADRAMRQARAAQARRATRIGIELDRLGPQRR